MKIILITVFVVYTLFKRRGVKNSFDVNLNLNKSESGHAGYGSVSPLDVWPSDHDLDVMSEIIKTVRLRNISLITDQVYVPYTPDQVEMIFMEAEYAISQNHDLIEVMIEMQKARRLRNTPLPFTLTDPRLIECEQHLLNAQRNQRSGGSNEQYVEQVIDDFLNDTTLNMDIDLLLTLFS